MSQKLSVNNKDFIKVYKEGSDEECFLEFDVQYHEKLPDFHIDLPLLSETMKIEKVEKLVTNAHEKIEYVVLIRNLKQALNLWLALKKFHRVIKFNEKAWLKPYVKMNTKLKRSKK